MTTTEELRKYLQEQISILASARSSIGDNLCIGINIGNIEAYNNILSKLPEPKEGAIANLTVTQLQNSFIKDKGIECINSQGEPEIDYMQWLEQKIIASPFCKAYELTSEKKEWYEKLLKKLQRIQTGELKLEDYYFEVLEKTEPPKQK